MVTELHGLLAVHKPPGFISKDVSRWLVKRVGRVKLGHVGTLDPAASGVLPILLGKATRLQDFLLELPKTYEFDLTLGTETDTLDQDGQIVKELPWDHVTEEALRAAAATFLGEIEQIPPIYSAVKYKGKALYEYARGDAADDVPLPALTRRVTIHAFEMLAFRPGMGTFRVRCSKGTYVRTLVKDLAQRVGTCGTLTRLVRTEAAGVALADSLTLETLESQLAELRSLVIPMESLGLGMPRWRSPRAGVTARLRGGLAAAVEPAEYLEGLGDGDDRSLPPAWARPLLLRCESGSAFGIGSVRRQESGRVEVVMKRGL